MKNFGLFVDPTFSFVRRIGFIVTKAYFMLGFFYENMRTLFFIS